MKLILQTALIVIFVAAIYVPIVIWIVWGVELNPNDKFLISFIGLVFTGFAGGIFYTENKKQ